MRGGSGERAEVPADDASVVAWLTGRGLGEDREPEFGLWLDLRAAARISPSMLPSMLVAVLLARPALRRWRSRPGSIGAFQADVDRVTGRVSVLRPAALRLAAAGATGIALHLSGASALVATAVAALVLVMRVASWWVLLTGVVAVVLAPSAWLTSVTAVVLAWSLYTSAQLRRMLDRPLGPGLGFIPLRTVLGMMRGRTWPLLADGLDKALGDDWQRAEPYLAAVEDRLPAGYRTVVPHARALVLGRQGEFARAFALLAAEGPHGEGPANLRAWCAGIEGELLMLAGQRAAALEAYRRAADGLRGRRTVGLRAELGFKLVDAAIVDRRWLDAYRELAVIRWQAVRTAALSLVLVTEGHVCRMMIAVGNTAGAVWELETLIVPTDTRRVRINERGEATARWHLVLAEAHRVEGRGDQAREQADMALTRARTTHSPGLDAAAHLFLAELCRAAEPDRALRHASTALRRLQALRYQLPAASWRVQWLSTYAGAFSTAFDLAERAGDAPLVAELIEAVKSQGLPVASAGTSYGSLAPAATGSGSVAPPAPVARSAVATALAAVGVDVLTPPEPVLVSGTSWTQDDATGGWDLEAEVRALAPGGWYWTGCIAADRYRWATLSPLGAWTSGSVDLSRGTAAADALGRLLAALPVRRPDEDEDDFQDRMAASPLVHGWGHRRDRERALMHDVADALLPPPVRIALSAADPAAPTPLLVSLPGLLSTVPVSALPVGRDGDTRVVEVAVVAVAPAIATLASVRRRGVTPSAPAESVIAVVDPDPDRPLPHAAAPPFADPVLGRPATRADLRGALRTRRPGRPGLLYVAAHHDVAEAFGSRGAGVGFADGLLGLQDLLDRSPTGEYAYPMPPVVLLSACDSLGALSSDQVVDRGGYGLESAGEWLGLVVGALLAGAEHVVSTSFPLLEDAVTTEMDQEIAAALAEGTAPSLALRQVQVRHLGLWRSAAERRPPAVWQAYTYVGVGPVGARRQAGAPAAA